MMNKQLSRSTIALVVSVVVAMGLLIGLLVGRWLSLLGLSGLEVFEVDQESRGTLAAEQGLALRLMIGMGIGAVSAVAVGLIGLGGLVSLVGVKALVGREYLLSRLVVGLGLALLIGMAAGLIIALVGSLMGFGSEVNASGLGGLGVGLVVGLIAGLLALAALVGSGGLGGLSNQEGFAVRLSTGWGAGMVAGVVWGLVMGIVGLSGLKPLSATFVALITGGAAVVLVSLGILVGSWWPKRGHDKSFARIHKSS